MPDLISTYHYQRKTLFSVDTKSLMTKWVFAEHDSMFLLHHIHHGCSHPCQVQSIFNSRHKLVLKPLQLTIDQSILEWAEGQVIGQY